MKVKAFIRSTSVLAILTFFTSNAFAQAPATGDLPEYVIVTTENTRLIGGIGLDINWKKSPYKAQLIQLYDYLTEAKQNRVRTQIDLLNVMSELGFEYINAFNSNAGTVSGSTDVGDGELGLGSSKFRVNIVFRKKEKFRAG